MARDATQAPHIVRESDLEWLTTRCWDLPRRSPHDYDPTARTKSPHPLFLGDVHGAWNRVIRVLKQAGLIDPTGDIAIPSGTTLVQVGDLIDRSKRVARHAWARTPDQRTLTSLVRRLRADNVDARVSPPNHVDPTPVTLEAVARGDVSWPEEVLEQERRALWYACDSAATIRMFMALEAAAQAQGGQVIVLLGNHELDLVRGGFSHARRQKHYLMAMLGATLELAAEHARNGVGLEPLLDIGSPALEWLAGRPILALSDDVLAVHGGPAHDLVHSLDVLGVHDVGDLGRLLLQGRTTGFSHPLFREGRSIVSPGGTRDDPIRHPVLSKRLLGLTGTRTIAIGHSPFLSFQRGSLQDIDDPLVRAQLEVPALLGQTNELLKLDTDMKRGGPAWLVWQNTDLETWIGLREDGARCTLQSNPSSPETLEEPLRGACRVAGRPHEPRDAAPGGKLEALGPEGPDAERFEQLNGAIAALEQGGSRNQAHRLRNALFELLYLGLSNLAFVEMAARCALHGDHAGIERVERILSHARTRCAKLVARLEGQLACARGGLVRFCPSQSECNVDGRPFHLAPAAVKSLLEARSNAQDAAPIIVAASFFRRRSRPFVRLEVYAGDAAPLQYREIPLSQWPADPDEIDALIDEMCLDSNALPSEPESKSGAEPQVVRQVSSHGSQKTRPGGPVKDPSLHEALAQWARANLDNEAPLQICRGYGPDRLELNNRFLLFGHEEEPTIVLHLPDGALLPANPSFGDPARRFQVVRTLPDADIPPPRDHATWLLRYLEDDPLVLYSAVSEDVRRWLHYGELEHLGMQDPARPFWQRGRYLFTSPEPRIVEYFYNKQCIMTFRVPRNALARSIEAELVNINLFLSDKGETLDPHARMGARDIGLEVVAIDEAGISWLMDHLLEPGKPVPDAGWRAGKRGDEPPTS